MLGKTPKSLKSGRECEIEVDFLTEPQGAEALPNELLASVRADLKACAIEGGSIVFKPILELT
jgi:hypothetical protein